jgi:hypothetical protein
MHSGHIIFLSLPCAVPSFVKETLMFAIFIDVSALVLSHIHGDLGSEMAK